ncbi:hypothetical protein J6590_048041 [Homalodisca vitripennis]|nr:hypothetical protein J6590_048041 [Homalodisca vitripennis]
MDFLFGARHLSTTKKKVYAEMHLKSTAFPSLYIYETIIYARFHCASVVDEAAIHDHNTRARVDLRQTQHRSALAGGLPQISDAGFFLKLPIRSVFNKIGDALPVSASFRAHNNTEWSGVESREAELQQTAVFLIGQTLLLQTFERHYVSTYVASQKALALVSSDVTVVAVVLNGCVCSITASKWLMDGKEMKGVCSCETIPTTVTRDLNAGVNLAEKRQ